MTDKRDEGQEPAEKPKPDDAEETSGAGYGNNAGPQGEDGDEA